MRQVFIPKPTNTVRPGDFLIGSPQSRAAARALMEQAHAGRKRIEIVTNVFRPWHGEGPEPEDWNGVPRIGPWQECGDYLMRIVYHPGEWLRIPPDNIPICPSCGTPFRRADKQIGDWAWVEADCMARHATNQSQYQSHTSPVSEASPA